MTKSKPNILFILVDQHNAKVLGHKNHPDVLTPNLDKMAEEGVRFDNAICQNPICSPSRISFLSGQYCHNHGYYGNGGPNPGGLPSIFGHFRMHGYKTAAVGKIHCPEYWIEDDCDLFSEVYPRLTIYNEAEYDYYLEEKGLYELRDDNMFNRHPDPERRKIGLDGRESDLSFEDCVEAWTSRKAISFMKEASQQGNPFFVHCSLPRPHQSWLPSEPFWSMYDEKSLHLPPNCDYDNSLKAPHFTKKLEHLKETDYWMAFEPKTYEAARLRKLHGYLGCISMIDQIVGDMLSWLEKNNLAENTIVIYSSDHGDYACEHGLMEKNPGICSDAVTRVPFIWQWKNNFKKGHVAKEVVESVDMSSTLCSLCGIDAMETSDGKDLSGLLRGAKEAVHKVGVTEFPWSKSVRKGKYRFVYYPPEMFAEEYPDGFGELYDLEQDPWEMKNLFFEDDYAATVKEMNADLMEWLITTTRPTVVHGVRLEPGPQRLNRFRYTVNHDGKINPEAIREQKRINYI